ncbi:PKD domain-containing protein, partial [Maribacter sp. CXY002]|uniref:PKD domain-containing protein n=1 Tax=Maribacter luteocoastalis TaxID=3407671 RepID=UPI003B676E1E
FEVRASGADIWGSADEFHFVYRELTGNGEIIARVTALEQTNAYAKAGVMMRNSLAANAKHAQTTMSPVANNGAPSFYFQHRNTTGGATTSTTATVQSIPYYVRMVRFGNDFTSAISPDGLTWTDLGTQTITMGTTIYVGLATTSHADGTLATSTYDNVVFNATSPGTPPTAIISAPTPPVSGQIPFTVAFDGSTSTDTNGFITAYNWDFGDGSNPVTGATPTHTFLTPGTYTVTLNVTDNDSEIGATTIDITVDPTVDCNGTAVSPEWRIPSISGSYQNGNPLEDVALIAQEGEEVRLSLVPNQKSTTGANISFDVYKNGDLSNSLLNTTGDFTINNVALNDAAIYTLVSADGCEVNIDLSVEGFDCVGTVVAEWAINGSYAQAPDYNQVTVTAETGDNFIIGMEPGNIDFEVIGTDGTTVLKAMGQTDYTFPDVLAIADSGIYTINTEQGCTTSIDLQVSAYDCTNAAKFALEYGINGTFTTYPSSNDQTLNVTEGENIAISMDPNGINQSFTVQKLPGGTINNVASSGFFDLGAITLADSGDYEVISERGCTAILTVNVNPFVCNAEALRPEYIVDGQTFQAQDANDLTITAYRGLPLTLGIYQDNLDFRILDENGIVVKPMDQTDLTIGGLSDNNIGPFTIETEQGCSLIVTINLECGADFYNVSVNNVIKNVENFVPIKVGDRVKILSNLDINFANVRIISPSGAVENDSELDLLYVDETDSGIYTIEIDGGICSYEIDIQVQCIQPAGVNMFMNFYAGTILNKNIYSLGVGADIELGMSGVIGDDYTVTSPDGTVTNGMLTLNDITIDNQGLYSFLPNGGCPFLFYLAVCDGEPAVPEYTINGVTTQGFGPIYLRGNVDSFQLGLVGYPNAVIVYPTGAESLTGDSEFFPRAGCALQGTWKFRNAGCDLGSIDVYVSLPFPDYNGGFSVNGVTQTTTDVTLNPGDPFLLSYDTVTDYEIVNPQGVRSTGPLNIASLSTADAGYYVLINNDDTTTCSLGINLSVGNCNPQGIVTEYRVNTGPLQNYANTTIEFGDNFYLGLKNLSNYTITNPSGSLINGPVTITGATGADIGTYTLTTDQGCSVYFNLDVICSTGDNLISEVTFFGTTYTNISTIGIDDGATVTMGIQGETNFTVISPNGTSNPTGTYTFTASVATEGLYELISENGGCSTTVFIGVCAANAVVANYTINGVPTIGNNPIVLNEGDDFSIGVESLAENEFSIQNPFSGISIPGTFSITGITTSYTGQWLLSNNSTGCFQSIDVTVNPTAINQPPISVVAANPVSGEVPLLVNFDGSASTDDIGIVSYTWDYGDGSPTETGSTASHTFTMAGTYTVTLSVTDNDGVNNTNTDTNSVQITVTDPVVNDAPVAVASATPLSGDAPLLVTFTGSASTDDSAVVSHSWDFGDGSALDNNADTTHTYTSPGTYGAVLTVTDAEGLTDTMTITVTVTDPVVNDAPVAVASATPLSGDAPLLVTFTGSASTDDSAVVSHSWDFGDGSALDSNADTTHTYTVAGTYGAVLTVTDAEGLTDTMTITVTVTDPVVNDAP